MQTLAFITQTIPVTAVKIAFGDAAVLHAGNLSSLVKFINDKAALIINNTVTLRDFIRLAFAELGIDIEFSGRNENEKGVIIDIDEERVAELGLNLNALRFGQTVVRVNMDQSHLTEIELMLSDANLNHQTIYSPEVLISQLVKVAMQQVKAGE